MSSPDFMHYYSLSSGAVTFSTRRHGGGISKGPYSEMNINPYCGDNLDAVAGNTAILAKALCLTEDKIILPHQVHKTNIAIVDNQMLLLSKDERETALDGIDGVITSLKDVCIGVSTADCVPVLLFDCNKKIAAAVHAGWRGTVGMIAKQCVCLMKEQFQSNPKDIRALIGPSISKASFEVGKEVYDQFAKAGFPMAELAERINSRWHIDLWEANRLQLLSAGLCDENIQIAGICTFINHEDFFSARRLSINSGRIYTGIVIR